MLLLVALAAAGPASPLLTSTVAVDLPNPTLLVDDGTTRWGADTTAQNGRPDGWNYQVATGSLSFAPGEAEGKQATTTVTVAPGTTGSMSTPDLPATAGSNWVLRTRVHTGGKPMPVSLGVAFMAAKGSKEPVVGLASHRVEPDGEGWRDVEILATAPAGTERLRLRWVATGAGTTEAASFQMEPITLSRLEASSTARALALPHVFLVTIETFRWDHASLYGYDRATTPNLARVAGEGAYFTRHYVQAPYTRPSLSSLVTSRYPAALGIADNVQSLSRDVTTVAELFSGAGYLSGGFLAQFLLSSQFGFHQGFHAFFNHPNDTDAGVVASELVQWMSDHPKDNTFVWTHLFDPHGPYRPSAEWAGRFVGDELWNRDDVTLAAGVAKARGSVIPAYVYDEGKQQRRHYVAGYDADIAYADHRLGEIFAQIDKMGWRDSSLVIVTADHGESMTDHEKFFAHGTLYDHDLHVPMVVWAPGRVPAGAVVSERSSHLDIVPTLLDYAGIKAPTNLQGRSLRGLMSPGGKAPQPFTVASVGAAEAETTAVYGDKGLKVVVDAAGKVVEAYDLGVDPAEKVNVAEARSAEATAMAASFSTWMKKQLTDEAPKPKRPARQVDDAEAEMLRQLGYME